MSTKRCAKCKEHLPHLNFNRNRQQKDGIDVYCKPCRKELRDTDKHRATMRAWYHKNKEKVRDYKLQMTYGIGQEEFIAMFDAQGNKCKICGTDETTDRIGFVVDHDHDTGKVRGILCNQCNRGLGMFKDNSNLLFNAGKYLQGK